MAAAIGIPITVVAWLPRDIDGLTLLLVAVLAVLVAVARWSGGRRTWLDGPVLLFGGGLVLGGIFGGARPETRAAALASYAVVLSFYQLVVAPKGRRWDLACVLVIASVAITSTAWSFLYWSVDPDQQTSTGFVQSGKVTPINAWLRPALAPLPVFHFTGLPVVPLDDVGGVLAPLAGLAAGGAIAARARLARVLLLAAALAALVGAALTSSRSAWIAALVALAIVAAQRVGARRAWLVVPPGLLAAGALTALGLGEQFGPDLRSRLELWRASLDLLLGSPVVGLGPGGFAEAIAAYGPTHFDENSAHDILLQVYADAGPLGVAAFAWAAGLVRAGSRDARSGLVAGTTAALAGLAAFGVLNDVTTGYVFLHGAGSPPLPMADPLPWALLCLLARGQLAEREASRS